jgi:cellulose synthase/poly-beta-1,6-N-acetylglucosamine synthase-like glycosyltransferase
MALPPASLRVGLDGKFFRLAERKFFVKGVTYGPFALSERKEPFASAEQTARDFALIRELGANVVRVYHVPPMWLLDLAREHELRVMIDVPWQKDLCFLDSQRSQQEARTAVRDAVRSCERHPAVFAFSVVNEIPADVVRWSGVKAVSNFIDELVDEAKSIDGECLCTFSSYPPTEFLHSTNIDFVCFNVYLHQRKSFENYLARLQMLADSKPLLLGEFGIDSIREGEEAKTEMLAWQIESAFRAGLAGTVLFSFSDDWHRGGQQIADWGFGVTTLDRKPKRSFSVVQKFYNAAPYFPLPRHPKVSVVVACYNGGRTLKACLDSLTRLNYPDYEVILVDDGSTDNTPEIAQVHAKIRYIRQPNLGLSVARNTGIGASTGEIIAFTDADCRADEDWLYYMVADLLRGDFTGIGGHNFLPPEDSVAAAAVMVSPGGPAHVMLTDREAEHVPGCNMAFYKTALLEIGGFDPVFRKAGDDVDVCWRLMEHGYKIGFSPAGFVWHYRRSNVRAYLKQQAGYGEAEALLSHKHPEYFSPLGGSIWRGRIYTQSQFGVTVRRPVIYHGLFGAGFFQKLYSPAPAHGLMLCTSLEYHVLITLPLAVLSVAVPPLLPLLSTSMSITLGVCIAAAAQADLPRRKRRWWSQPLIALLFFLQPIVRGWSRYQWRLIVGPQRKKRVSREALALHRRTGGDLGAIFYGAEKEVPRFQFLDHAIHKLEEDGWQTKLDTGWTDHDVEIYGQRWARLRLTTAREVVEGRTVMRCRLHANWSLRAKLVFWALLGAELALVGLLGNIQPWLWMILLTVPLAGWFLEQEKRNLQAMIAVALTNAANELGMTRLKSRKPDEQLVPA